METEQKRYLRNNPIFAISVASLIALLMTVVSFSVYYNSDTRLTVEQLQQNNMIGNDTSGLNLDSVELSETYIDGLQNKLSSDILSLSEEVDYNPDELTNSALGL